MTIKLLVAWMPVLLSFLLGVWDLVVGDVTIDANGWVLIIGAIFFGLAKLWSMWLDFKREEWKQKQLATVAEKAENTDKKLDDVTSKVEEVHKATNSLTDRLVETTRIEAHAAGMKEEQDRPRGAKS